MNNLFNRIIVAYDDSPGSERALQFGIELMKNNNGSELIVAQVFEEKTENSAIAGQQPIEPLISHGYIAEGTQISPIEGRHYETSQPTHAKIINSVDQAFFKAKETLKAENIEADFEVLEGSPADSVCEYAKSISADIIIAGSSQNTGLKKIFLGSNSEKIVKNAPCTVLIAK